LPIRFFSVPPPEPLVYDVAKSDAVDDP